MLGKMEWYGRETRKAGADEELNIDDYQTQGAEPDAQKDREGALLPISESIDAMADLSLGNSDGEEDG
jgi:hypothetical protein